MKFLFKKRFYKVKSMSKNTFKRLHNRSLTHLKEIIVLKVKKLIFFLHFMKILSLKNLSLKTFIKKLF